MQISFPTNTNEVITAIRQAIGRPIEFYQEYLVKCSGCDLDQVTGLSTNPFHVPCGGRGYFITYSGVTITGHINWAPTDNQNWQTGGTFFTGSCSAQIAYNIENLAIVNNADYLVVDTRHLRIKNKIFRGVPSINRILLDLELEEE
jgi:hypothetical protein